MTPMTAACDWLHAWSSEILCREFLAHEDALEEYFSIFVEPFLLFSLLLFSLSPSLSFSLSPIVHSYLLSLLPTS